ncbi:MAG: GNAT family N-acetyltransferase [Flavisolibacter sp.]
MQIQWILKRFEELTPYQLYAILQLRNEVFVVEQNCVFQDADGKDQDSFHLMGFLNTKLVAYTRIVPAGIIYDHPSIGRVVTSPSVRSSGMGRALMQKSIDTVYTLFGKQPIKIGAQFYLKNFYSSLGFQQISDIYLEDGIDHIYMLKEATE